MGETQGSPARSMPSLWCSAPTGPVGPRRTRPVDLQGQAWSKERGHVWSCKFSSPEKGWPGVGVHRQEARLPEISGESGDLLLT